MIKKILISISFLLIFGLLFLYFFQEKFIFLNGNQIDRDYQFNFENNFEEVFLKTEDNQEINAVHLKLPNPKGIVLFFHGNKGNIKRWGKRAAHFLNYNYEVFIIDYRNYGKSTGNFNENKMYEDALLAYNYVNKKYNENEIIVYGFSLGSTFATKVASENTPKKLILEAPFYNLNKAVEHILPITPSFLLKYNFNTNDYITSVKVPITIFHGNEDETTSFSDSKKLLKLNNNSKNEFIAIKKGTHHNIRRSSIYKQKLKEILN
ncbi:alpha/beta hydrolase [Polaribacter aestuariivivens]|uniref:Alpha/beta hydrolase n=1 Tax=Polaribacter aestuariivivens TaxID=2304626 RepID=A0A5S3N2W9_9FLAO|nr:alpha/beta hydrolase [Polaribacter aestuariivivens]TMM29600.1 alpha/beta hydrolase [Polaribacter aestuariivivens]